MKWIKNLLYTIWHWLCRQPKPLRTIRVEDLPDILKDDSVYLVGEGEYFWFVAMLCPCGCKSILHMSLMPDGRPRWKIIEHEDHTISLQPSVWRQVDCQSHFYLRKGFIEWCHPDR